MRLYVENPETKEHVHLQIVAKNRQELIAVLGSSTFEVQGCRYSVDQVRAETGSDNTAISALIGGIIGAVGGGTGVLTGSAIGAFIGGLQNNKERAEVESFNRSST